MQTTAVYACVRILAEAIAGLPLHVYRYKSDGGKEKALNHPLYYLLHTEPNPEMTSFVFRETMMSHILLWGNAYAQIIRDGAGRVLALYPLLPEKMTVDRTASGQLFYEYRSDIGSVILRPEDVLHIPGLGFDGLIGYSPVAMAKNAIGMAIACEEYGASFFANGANPGGVLEHPGVVKDPKRVRESWNTVYQGSANAHRIAVLEEGMKFQSIGIPPEQAQFLETRKFQINEIARIFRVPPHMVGDLEKSSFSNIEQQSLEFVKYTLDPWVVRWEQAIQKSLLLPSEKLACFRKDVLGEFEDTKKVLFEDSNAVTKQFALLFEFTGDTKEIKHVLYNCKATRPNVESATKGQSIEAKTETLNLSVRPAIDTGLVKAKTTDAAADADIASWYTTVYLENESTGA